MTLELTTSFRNVSTAGGRDPAERAGSAAAHLRYIERGPAVEFRASAGLPDGPLPIQRAALRQGFRDVAEKGGARGARVAEKLMITMPRSWGADDRKEALNRVLAVIAPPGSEVRAWGTVHRDSPGNPHMHLIAIDGQESRESALARKAAGDYRKHPERDAEAALLGDTRPKKQRLKRRNVLRLGDKRRAKELRAEIAGALNGLAAERGLERVEHRSFKARGIEGPAMVKEGPAVRRGHDPGDRAAWNAKIRTARAREQAEIEDFLSGGMAQPAEDLFGPDPAPVQDRPPRGWIPGDDAQADADFNRAEAKRMAARAAAERAENERVRKQLATVKKQRSRGPRQRTR